MRRRFSERALGALMRLAPALPEGMAGALGRGIGGLAGRIQPQRAMVLRHLRLAFGDELPEREIRRLARAFYAHTARTFFEILRLGSWSREEVLARTELVGQEHLDAALAQGKGAIVIGGHLGNWEIGGAALAQRGYRLDVVSQPQRHPALEEYLVAARRRHGVGLIPLSALRECFACLRAGGLLVLLIDQQARQGAVIVPFFGRPAATAPGPAAIARRTGAPVLPVATRRLPDGRHQVIINPPVPLVETGDPEADLIENTARFQQAIEAAIRRAPEQWLWLLPRWNMRRVQVRGAAKGEGA